MADACVIGVDLGGTKLLAGTVDAELRVHHRAYRLSRHDAALETIVEAAEEAREAARGEVLAVGVGVPCLVTPGSGVAMACNHFPLIDVPLRDLLAERLGLPVVVDNDGTAALVAEWRYGAARGTGNALMLTIGTGIGGGILAGGHVVRGASGAAGELGHIVIDESGPPCPGNCPNHGCLEAFVSGPALAIEGRARAGAEPEAGLGRALAAGREIKGAAVPRPAPHGAAPSRRDARSWGRSSPSSPTTATPRRGRRSRCSAATWASASPGSSTSSTPRSWSSAAVSWRRASCCSSRRGRSSPRARSCPRATRC